MKRPLTTICAGEPLFSSFFTLAAQRRLSSLFRWKRSEDRELTPKLKRLLAESEALITTWDSPEFGADLIEIAPRLRIIAHCGGEVKRRFATPLFDTLTITNAAGPMARATAEMGAAFLLYCARNVDSYRQELRKRSNRIYTDRHAHGSANETLMGREVSMIGFGRIGRALVDLLRGFDIRWLVYDPFVGKDATIGYPVRLARLDSVLKKGHLLVLTAALTEQTRGMLNRETLKSLPDGAAVINIARGGLIDLDALTREVRKRRLRCALDVTDPAEPLPLDHPLRDMPGAIMTPHVAGSPQEVRHGIAEVVLDDLARFFRNEPVHNRVTTSMLERMT